MTAWMAGAARGSRPAQANSATASSCWPPAAKARSPLSASPCRARPHQGRRCRAHVARRSTARAAGAPSGARRHRLPQLADILPGWPDGLPRTRPERAVHGFSVEFSVAREAERTRPIRWPNHDHWSIACLEDHVLVSKRLTRRRAFSASRIAAPAQRTRLLGEAAGQSGNRVPVPGMTPLRATDSTRRAESPDRQVSRSTTC